MSAAAPAKSSPFPGLRPFTQKEDYLFFGREEQTLELLQRLGSHRFVTVVGTSGSGKSSLVRCGLLSELLGGRMLGAGAAWEVAVTHPGGNPLALLTDALLEADLYDRQAENARENLLATLSRSHFGLVEAVKQAGLGAGTNFLLVVDQFEEIFRFQEAGQRQQEVANEFVSLLLEAVAQTDVPVYVVLTMRSDFIGECGQFEGLAEMVNRGEFLIPRLTREQYKRVIEGPVKVAGGQIAPRLLQRLLNDLGQQPDQLPCLQHALMRTWNVWAAEGKADALDLDDYQRVGRMSQALSLHADEVYASLADDRQRELCRGLFQALTVEESNGRGIRRPQRLGRLCQILEVPAGELLPVIDAYRHSGVTFLMPSPDVELTDATIVDISHESLMRVWTRLRQWVEEETQAAGIYHRLSESADLHERGKAGLYRDPELGIALAWRDSKRPNAAWAERYRPGFAAAIAFLEASREASVADEQARDAARRHELEQAQELAEARRLRLEHQHRAARRLRTLIGGLAVVALVAGLACVFALFANRRANMLADKARDNATRAEQSRQEADQARAASETSRIAAQAETYRAMLSEVVALRAGHQLGWREEALANLARLVVMPTPRRDLVELRSEAVASIGDFEVKEVARFEPTGLTVSKLDFSPDSGTLVTASNNGDLSFWDIPGRKHRARLAGVAPEYYAGQVLFLPDGELAFVTKSGGVAFLSESGQPSARAPIQRAGVKAAGLEIDRQSGALAVRWEDGRIDLIAAGTNAPQQSPAPWRPVEFTRGPDGEPVGVAPAAGQGPSVTLGQRSVSHFDPAFSPDGTTVAGVVGRSLVLWDVASKRELMRLGGHKEGITGIAFSPDGEMVATTCGDSMTRIWDARDGKALAVLPGPWYMRSLTFSPDGAYLAASADPGPVCLYQLGGRREQRRLVGHTYGSLSVAFHPSQPRLVSSSDDGFLIVWDTDVARPVLKWQGRHGERGLAYSPDGSLIASSTGGGDTENPFAIRLWDADKGANKTLLRGHQANAFAMAFSPTSDRVASGDISGAVIVWEVSSGQILRREQVANSPVTAASFHNAGRQLIAGAAGGDVVLFDLDESGPARRVHLPDGCWRLVVDHTANRAIVGDYTGSLLALSLPDLGVIHRMPKAHDGAVASLAISPDGRLLVTSGMDRRVVLRDATTFNALLTLPAWTGVVRDCAFDASGRLLAMAGSDSDVALWDLGRVRDELAAIGLAWDQPAPAVVPALAVAAEGVQTRPAVPVVRIPAVSIDSAEFERVRALLQAGFRALEAGRRVDAIRDLQQARDALRTMYSTAAGIPPIDSTLAISLVGLGAALRDEQRPAEAVSALEEARQVLEAIRQPAALDLYNLACAYASLGALVDPGPAELSADRRGLADRAMEALRRSIAAGMTDFARMDRDHDLDPLRERPDFRALILIATGHPREALPHLVTFSAANPQDVVLSLRVAALQAWFGQDPELAATRKRILEFAKDTGDLTTADCAAKACSILPSTDKAELEAALALGRKAVELNNSREWNLLALGMAEYRTGNDAAAGEALSAAANAGPGDPRVMSISAFYRAMSLFRQGKAAEARALAIGAAANMKPLPADVNNPLTGDVAHDDLIAWMAYKEARAMIEFDATLPPSPNTEQ